MKYIPHTGRLLRRLVVVGLFLCAIAIAPDTHAQRVTADTVIVEDRDTIITDQPDTVLIDSHVRKYDPRRALLYAAILPGLGQVYNKKYWKVPLVYGGFVGLGYGLMFYRDQHLEIRGHLFTNLEAGIGANEINEMLPAPFNQTTTETIRTLVDRTRRQRDFFVLLMGGMYLLQMVDAHVDAHLKEFDVNPNLQVKLEPSLDQDIMTGRTMGVAVVLRFK